ncbi:hypothetical protein LINGRAHAP2_LOCUS31534, partial [Linum grandiflorum]
FLSPPTTPPRQRRRRRQPSPADLGFSLSLWLSATAAAARKPPPLRLLSLPSLFDSGRRRRQRDAAVLQTPPHSLRLEFFRFVKSKTEHACRISSPARQRATTDGGLVLR